MPKSTKRFILTDDSLNRHGFRVLTKGVNLDQFHKNPIALWMHGRAWSNSKDTVLPIGHWQDIEVKNNQITAVPFFSDDDDFAMSIYKKVEEGTVRMASAGLDPTETSEDEKYILPGQRYATVTKSVMLEASLVDMGANDNACALYKDGALIQLADGEPNKFIPLLNKNSKNMNPQFMALAIMLGLGKDATEIQLAEKLTAQHGEFVTLQKDKAALELQLADIKAKFEALEKSTAGKAVEDMLTLAVDQGKITAAQKPEFATLAAANFESVQNLLAKMPAHTSAQQRLADGGNAGDDPLLKLSYEELHKSGQLALVKDKYPEHYKTIFKAKFGSEPKA